MTNENKTTNRLVAPADDDPTSEIEIPEVIGHTIREFEPEIEVDEDTYDIDELEAENAGRSRTDLIAAVEVHAAAIAELEFEVEQLRNKRRGLEKELSVREEITADINYQIRELQRQLADVEKDRRQRNEKNESLASDLETARALSADLEREAAELKLVVDDGQIKIQSLEQDLEDREAKVDLLQDDLNSGDKTVDNQTKARQSNDELESGLEAKIRNLRTELAELQGYIDGRKNEWEARESEIATLRNQIGKNGEDAQASALELDERNSQLVRSREQYIKASEDLKSQKARVRKVSKENRELKKALHHDAELEIQTCRVRIAEQSGENGEMNRVLDGLRTDNVRFEQYADSLRMQLQDQLSISKVSVAMRHKLEVGLDIANDRIETLTRQLNDEKILGKELSSSSEELRKQFEAEIKQIRFELGAAQDTLADQETVNEQLATDLIDHRSFRQALEAQLGEIEKESEITALELTRQLEKARSDSDDYERKLRIKDTVIADLMQELANHSSNIEFGGDMDNMLQKIDGFRVTENDRKTRTDRERLARQLIGNADGKELRFPLFKDRLTIGRTSHNDIQLNMQYISRRHAVIATDNNRTRVIDWGSRNGVFVNEKRVTEKILKSGDIVTIGTTDFRYEERNKR